MIQTLIILLVFPLFCFSYYLYGFKAPFPVQLVRYDSESGMVDLYTPYYDDFFATKLATYHKTLNYLFTLSFDEATFETYVQAYDLKTGKRMVNIKTELLEGEFLDLDKAIHYDPYDDKIYFIGRKDDFNLYLNAIDGQQVTELVNLSETLGDVTLHSSCYDFNKKIIYLRYTDEESSLSLLNAYSLKSSSFLGEISNEVKIAALEYNNKTKLINGVGLDANDSRVFYQFDYNKTEFKTIAVYKDYYYMYGDVSGIDLKDGVYFVVLCPIDRTKDYELLTIDIKTGNILYDPEVTPFAIEYLN